MLLYNIDCTIESHTHTKKNRDESKLDGKKEVQLCHIKPPESVVLIVTDALVSIWVNDSLLQIEINYVCAFSEHAK